MEQVRLSSLEARCFRSLRDVSVPFREHVTVVIGENNGGKSNLVDAIRLLTDPLDGRRERYWETEDVSRMPDADAATLAATYEITSSEQLGTYSQGALLDDFSSVRYQVTYTPPVGTDARGKVVWRAGRETSSDRDPEPEARDRLRHVYLRPLRDAQRELNSGSGNRLRIILRYLLAETDDVSEEDFVGKVKGKFGEIRELPILSNVHRAVRTPLADVTAGASPQDADVGFADPDLLSIARSLRIRMSDRGLDPRDIADSGLGYANLLFIATVLAELRAARDQDLTIFLVEEPEAHLHPQLQMLLLEYLRDAAVAAKRDNPGGFAGRIQAVVTTHSPLVAASTEIADLVVLKRHPLTRPAVRHNTLRIAENQPANKASSTGSGSTDGQSSAAEPSRPGSTFETKAIPLATLDLGGAEGKLKRYLDATRSAMLFGPHVILVEGIAEALLVPVFARRVLHRPPAAPLYLTSDEDIQASDEESTTERQRAAWARFVGSTLVPIDGVDFEPYVRVLLTGHNGSRIAERVAVITDEDPPVAGDRAARLHDLAERLGAADRLEVFVARPTLEPELLRADPANEDVLRRAYLRQRPQAGLDDWARITAAGDDRIAAFQQEFKDHNLRKGDFAQAVAELAAAHPQFTVPTYLHQAITWIAAAEKP